MAPCAARTILCRLLVVRALVFFPRVCRRGKNMCVCVCVCVFMFVCESHMDIVLAFRACPLASCLAAARKGPPEKTDDVALGIKDVVGRRWYVVRECRLEQTKLLECRHSLLQGYTVASPASPRSARIRA